jgi:8-hydroxy-5-deazaflavin:NADPH oxidoreductase
MTGNIGIIGKGNVGSALERGLSKAGSAVRSVGHDAEQVRRTAEWADVLFLAVPFGAIEDVLRTLGDAADGKLLVDVTNALTPDMQLALGFTTSGAEELQKRAPKAKVVKAFNTVFAQHRANGEVNGERLTLLVAGDDGPAKERVMALGKSIGFDPIDAGVLRSARYLEPLGYLNIHLGYMQKLGPEIGFRLVHSRA